MQVYLQEEEEEEEVRFNYDDKQDHHVTCTILVIVYFAVEVQMFLIFQVLFLS